MINAKLAKTSIPQIQNAAQNLSKQFAELSTALATESEPTAAAALDQFYSVANLFDEMLGQIWVEQEQCELEPIDYCPEMDEPTFEEIEQRMTALVKHLKKLGGASHDCFARFNRAWLFGLCQRSAYLVGALDWLVSESIQAVECEEAEVNESAEVTPNFEHRLSTLGDIGNTLALSDTVSMMVNKASSILAMLENPFANDDAEDRPSDEVVYYALRAVHDELSDIAAVVSAFHRIAVNSEVSP